MPLYRAAPVTLRRLANSAAINNSVTLVSDDVMTTTLDVGRWIVEGQFLYNGTANADVKFQFTFTGTGTGIGWAIKATTTMTSATGNVGMEKRTLNSEITSGAVAGIDFVIPWRMDVNVTVSGVFTVQYAQANLEVSDLVILAGSSMRYWRE